MPLIPLSTWKLASISSIRLLKPYAILVFWEKRLRLENARDSTKIPSPRQLDTELMAYSLSPWSSTRGDFTLESVEPKFGLAGHTKKINTGSRISRNLLFSWQRNVLRMSGPSVHNPCRLLSICGKQGVRGDTQWGLPWLHPSENSTPCV